MKNKMENKKQNDKMTNEQFEAMLLGIVYFLTCFTLAWLDIWLTIVGLIVSSCLFCYSLKRLHDAHQNRFTTFCVSTNLPYKRCEINSPYLIVIAQNETEFRQAITDLNATTIYYKGFHVYVFSSDYKIAYKYYVP